ncbi:MAG: 3'-5' exonuclease [Chania sp.]
MTPQQQAQQWLNSNCLILDTETTGLGDDAEIVEITIIDASGKVLLDTLIQPKTAIPAEATAIHGITNEMVAGAPRWIDIHKKFIRIITGRNVVIYNANYDLRLIYQTAKLWWVAEELPSAIFIHDCAMHTYAEFYGQKDEKRGGYKWQKLTDAAKQQGITIEGTPHRSLSDCLTTLEIIREMAIPPAIRAKQVVSILNRLLRIDPQAIEKLISQSVDCNIELVRNTVGPEDLPLPERCYCSVGALGIINALVHPHVIAATYDNCELTEFVVWNAAIHSDFNKGGTV